MTDDAIREVHGVQARENTTGKSPETIVIRERDGEIVIHGMHYQGAILTRWQARYLASKLYRLARRVREREEA